MKRILISLIALLYTANAYADNVSNLMGLGMPGALAAQIDAQYGSAITSNIVQTSGTAQLGTLTVQAGNDANRLHVFGGGGDADITYKFGDAGITAAQVFAISGSTPDADDDSLLRLCGAGLCNSSGRGSTLQIGGNEASNPGIYAFTGSTAGTDVTFAVTDDFIVETVAGADSLVIDTATAASVFSGTVTSSATSDLGWSVVNAANQACNTTCTSACVVGIDTLGTGGFLGCAVATADSCICAGAS